MWGAFISEFIYVLYRFEVRLCRKLIIMDIECAVKPI